MPGYQCTHSFGGVAVDSQLQKFLLGIHLGACAALVLGGDQPFIRRLIGVSTSPQVGSIYNMGVWDKAAAAWLRVDVGRTLENEAAARHQYQVTGRSLDNGGCIAEPHIVGDRCWVFLCILHCCMAIGRLLFAFVDARLESLPKENAEAVQQLLYRARTGVKLGATAAPDGKEARTSLPYMGGDGPTIGLRVGGPRMASR